MSLSPFMRTPFTDLGGSMINHQNFSPCAKMELDAVECLEAYGLIRGTKKCSVLFEDYYECHNKSKQMKRVMAMTKEREKQIKEGKLTGDDKYVQTPYPGCY